jgi:IS5 family transposase
MKRATFTSAAWDGNGKSWHFGMKAHVGADLNGLVHPRVTKDAAVSEFDQLPKRLHGEEKALYGDQEYWSDVHPVAARERDERYRVNRRPHPTRALTEYDRRLNRHRSAIRTLVEHAFQAVTHLWGFTIVRSRGLAKNTARRFTAFALANLNLVRRRLMPAEEIVDADAEPREDRSKSTDAAPLNSI